MKHTLLLAGCALMLAAPARAQKLKANQVPAVVTATFKQQFAHVSGVRWEKEGSNYEAGFEQGKTEMSALVNAKGELLETESELAPQQLPAPVRAALVRDYSAYKVTEAAKIVAAGTGATTYEAGLMKASQKRDVVFDASGRKVEK